MINFTNVKKTYGDFVAIDIRNLTVPNNCIFGFLGKNGAGKTTTIKTIIGMLKVTEGEIIVDKNNINTHSINIKKIIGYVPDKPNIYEL